MKWLTAHTHTRLVRFFSLLKNRYGEYDNVLYEIYNEPNTTKDDDWGGYIKPYAEILVDAIREIDPDHLIRIIFSKFIPPVFWWNLNHAMQFWNCRVGCGIRKF